MKRIRLKPASEEAPILFIPKIKTKTGGSLEREPTQH